MEPVINRRHFGAASAAVLATSHLAAAPQGQSPDGPWFDASYGSLPTAEQQVEGLDRRTLTAQTNPRKVSEVAVTGLPEGSGSFDRQVVAKMREGGHVGLTLGIAIEGKLAVARGYGVLSSHDPVPATPTSPGFLGSLTKPLCAMSALTLVKQRELDLDSRVLDVLPLQPLLKPGEVRQPEIDRVNVRMLMNHTSGLFNIVEQLFDRPYYAQLAAKGLLKLVHEDISQYDLVRRGMSIRFVSQPGTEAHYSGQGLQVLGRIVEHLSQRRLDQFMYEAMLANCGAKHHATMSYLSPETRLAINRGTARECNCLIPAQFDARSKRIVSWKFDGLDAPYGNHWGAADACGSSMMSVLDLVRFVCKFRGVIGPRLFNEAMTIPKVRNQTFSGLGWGCGKTNGAYQFGHGGAIPGARAFCESTWDGIQYAVLAVGEDDASFDAINQLVVKLGRYLKGRPSSDDHWRAYGYFDKDNR